MDQHKIAYSFQAQGLRIPSLHNSSGDRGRFSLIRARKRPDPYKSSRECVCHHQAKPDQPTFDCRNLIFGLFFPSIPSPYKFYRVLSTQSLASRLFRKARTLDKPSLTGQTDLNILSLFFGLVEWPIYLCVCVRENTCTNQSVMPSYGRTDIAFEKGEGPYLYSSDGRKYLDFGAGIAVTALGHNHPHLVKALTDQARALWHTSNLYHIPQQQLLADRLVETSFADRVFFCNSGAEAVEASIKLIRKYHSTNGNPERYRLIVFEGSFHGRTLATIAAGANDAHRAGFGPEVDGFDHVGFGSMHDVRNAVSAETAGVMIEPIQGEGGIRPADHQFLRDLRAFCDEIGLLLMFDEVQTGVGRTGKLWAHEWSGVIPDVISSAKGLGGGFPIGACLATAEASKGLFPAPTAVLLAAIPWPPLVPMPSLTLFLKTVF